MKVREEKLFANRNAYVHTGCPSFYQGIYEQIDLIIEMNNLSYETIEENNELGYRRNLHLQDEKTREIYES